MSYQAGLRIIADDTENFTSGNDEYERGQLELLADLFPGPGIGRAERVEEIERDVLALTRSFSTALLAQRFARVDYSPHHKDRPEGHLYFPNEPGPCTITLTPAASADQAWLDAKGERIAEALNALEEL